MDDTYKVRIIRIDIDIIALLKSKLIAFVRYIAKKSFFVRKKIQKYV